MLAGDYGPLLQRGSLLHLVVDIHHSNAYRFCIMQYYTCTAVNIVDALLLQAVMALYLGAARCCTL
jgi:hypothetical protein